MAYRTKFKFPGHEEGEAQLTKRQYLHTTATTVTNATATITSTIIASTTTTKVKGMKVKISADIEGKVELNQNRLRACRISKQ
jgi:hypothetical protein